MDKKHSNINVVQHAQLWVCYDLVSETNKVTIKLKRGSWEVEITCPEDKVKQIVENVLSGLDREKSVKQEIQEIPSINNSVPNNEIMKANVIKKSKDHVICRDLIQLLWQENWFKTEKNLSNVYEELARRGYHYDKTSISHSLADLVRETILTRVGSIRNYRYIQKRPPQP